MADGMSDRCTTWGSMTLSNTGIQLTDDSKNKKPVLEIPYKKIQGSQKQTKTDLVIEMKGDVSKLEEGDCQLAEIRLHVPVTATIAGNVEGKGTEKTAILHDHISKKIGGGEEADLGEVVTAFKEITLLAPRGIFTIELYAKHFRLEGKATRNAKSTLEWTVPLKNLQGMYLLDASQKDEGLTWLCLALAKPLRSGNQLHHCLVLQIEDLVVGEADEAGKIKTGALTNEQKNRKSKAGETMLSEHVTGELGTVVTRIFQGMSGVDVLKPMAGQDPIACSDRQAKQGYMYFMEKSILFVPAPAISIRLDNIEKVEFDGIGPGSGTVHVNFKVKATTHTFAGIEKKDVPALVSFIKAKNLPVFGLEVQPLGGPVSDDSEDVSDEGSYDSDGMSAESDEPKAKKAKKEKKEKKAKKEKKEKKEKKDKKA